MALRLPHGYFPTAIVKSSRLAQFVLTETIYAPDARLPKHSHERACFILNLRGTFTETFGRQDRFCKPLDLIFRPQEEIHSNHFHKRGGRCLNIEMEPGWLEGVGGRGVQSGISSSFRGGLLQQLALRLYKEFDEADDLSALAAEGIMLEMLAEAMRRARTVPERKPPAWLAQAREMIHAQLSTGFTHRSLARAVGVHPVHLASTFRHFYRCTIGEYARRLRIELACKEISASDAPLAKIALSVGFYDQSHFSRTFKQFTGMTPHEYRSLLRAA